MSRILESNTKVNVRLSLATLFGLHLMAGASKTGLPILPSPYERERRPVEAGGSTGYELKELEGALELGLVLPVLEAASAATYVDINGSRKVEMSYPEKVDTDRPGAIDIPAFTNFLHLIPEETLFFAHFWINPEVPGSNGCRKVANMVLKDCGRRDLRKGRISPLSELSELPTDEYGRYCIEVASSDIRVF